MRRILPSSVVKVLAVAHRIAAAAAVAHADVQVAIRAEREHPAVVVGERLVDRQQDRAPIGSAAIAVRARLRANSEITVSPSMSV